MAGIVALIAADVEPDLVAGVVLLDGAFLFPEPMRRQVLDTLVPELEGPHWADAIRSYFANSLMFGPFDPPELRSRILDRLSETPPQIPAELWRDIFESDWATEIVAARCPLLYIHATIPVPLDRFKELRPDALVGSVIGGGHYMALVVPEQVSAMIDRFLDVLPMTAAAYA
jgi:pimeloyl-ACP methyl ester carboxylesterase